MIGFRLAVVATVAALLASCDDAGPTDGSGGTAAGGSGGSGGASDEGGGSTTGGSAGSGGAEVTGGWHLTVYFTAVDSFFGGAPTAISGCASLTCDGPTDPDTALGSYPADFLAAVEQEGTGAISSGPEAGKYLCWSGSQPGSGYWLDTAPRDAQGGALVPYQSAAAHPSRPFGASFSIVDCGVDSATAEPMDASACADLQAGGWQVRDRFEADDELLHLDLYIGLQTMADMDGDPHFVDQIEAVTTLP